jgi:uncharacterized membrane protein YGL010W
MTRFGFVVQCAATAFTVYMLVLNFLAGTQTTSWAPAPPWTVAVAVALLAFAIPSVRWGWARRASAALAVIAAWYGLTIASTNPPALLGTSLGNLVVIGSTIVILGLGIQYWSRRPKLIAETRTQ